MANIKDTIQVSRKSDQILSCYFLHFRKLPLNRGSLKNLIFAAAGLFALAFFIQFFPWGQEIGNLSLSFFLPALSALFILARFLATKMGHLLDQPPLMVFLIALVIKLLGGLSILLLYLAKALGPSIEGSFIFLGIYLIFEILEIKSFLSILRPDSQENTPE